MEDVFFVVHPFSLFASTYCAEVFCSLRDMLGEKFKDHSAICGLVTTNLDIKVHLRVLDLEFREPVGLLLLDRNSLLVV